MAAQHTVGISRGRGSHIGTTSPTTYFISSAPYPQLVALIIDRNRFNTFGFIMRAPGKREDVPAALAKAGGSLHVAAKLLDRDVRFVKRWAARANAGKGFGNEPGQGRKRLIDADGARFARRAACRARRVCCKTIATRLFHTGHTTTRVSPETVRRALQRGSHGLLYRTMDKRQRLTLTHKAKRVAWAEQYMHESFGNWMWTDSKIFLEQKVSSKGHWQRKGQQPTVEVDKHPNKIHVYAGLKVLE